MTITAKMQGTVRSKTAWLALVTMLFGFWQTALPGVVPPEWAGIMNVVIGSVALIVRWFTDTSLEDKAPTSDDGSNSGV
jgi:uncharacterized membrane-anchored protein